MKEYILELTDEEAVQIQDKIQSFQHEITLENLYTFIYEARVLFSSLPKSLSRKLYDFQLHGQPFVIIRNFKLFNKDLETPKFKTNYSKAYEYYQKLIAIVSCNLGFIYQFNSKHNHFLIEDIFPVKNDRHK